jgi:GNAT superfamily N-acetyltransferase
VKQRTAKKHRQNPAACDIDPSGLSAAFCLWNGHLRDGYPVHIRLACERDAAMERAFVARLTPEVFAQCSLGIIKPSEESLVNELSGMNPTTEVGLLAVVDMDDRPTVVGLARYHANEGLVSCDCAVAVDPLWRKLGVGSILMHHLIGIARVQGIRQMYAIDAVRDGGAHALASRLGFRSCPDPVDPASVTFELELSP